MSRAGRSTGGRARPWAAPRRPGSPRPAPSPPAPRRRSAAPSRRGSAHRRRVRRRSRSRPCAGSSSNGPVGAAAPPGPAARVSRRRSRRAGRSPGAGPWERCRPGPERCPGRRRRNRGTPGRR
ncbi:hypothetical protein StrepF001_16270 [Streptomyces sp. F001]|nr:hypothetical protein StrepF001_16270 [Streptomyces sp. F001]